MNDQEIFLGAGVALLAVGLFVFVRVRDAIKLRTGAYQEHANRYGFRYEVSPDWDVSVLTFGEGLGTTTYSVTQGISKTDADKTSRIFEYKRVSKGGGKTNYSWGNALLIKFEEAKALPEFYCFRCPKLMGGFLNVVLSNLGSGFKDINFAGDEEFSDKTFLMGQDEGALRDFFSSSKRSEIMRIFKSLAPSAGTFTRIAFTKNSLFINPGQRVPAAKLAAFIKEGESAVETIIS